MKSKQGCKALSGKKADIQRTEGKTTIRRMMKIRSRILMKYPFYGMLLMRLQLGLSMCGTACTDMKALLFDPSFASQISDEEMEFVMLHEVLHCVLQHCRRGEKLHRELFNIACDIVVNSTILYFLGEKEFAIMGNPAMHLTPDGKEGYLFTAEQVYKMLVNKYLRNRETIEEGDGESAYGGKIHDTKGDSKQTANGNIADMALGRVDSHEIWQTINETPNLAEQWNLAVKETFAKAAGRGCSMADFPQVIRDYVMDLEHRAKVDWRDELRRFIQTINDRFDYSFNPPDERYPDSEFILPSFTKAETNALRDIWFCVDVSGSIRKETLSEMLSEIQQVLMMYSNTSMKISLFDTKVTEPILCDDEETLLNTTPLGGGGTSFQAIFTYLQKEMKEMPAVIIILTDGYCAYPKEKEALDIPVIWIIYDNSKDAPWGISLHVESGIG